jgi:hypothetical protein
MITTAFQPEEPREPVRPLTPDFGPKKDSGYQSAIDL